MKNPTSRKNRRAQRGQTMAEYAIIIALIALVCIGAVTFLGDKIRGKFQEAGEALDNGN